MQKVISIFQGHRPCEQTLVVLNLSKVDRKRFLEKKSLCLFDG